MSNSISSPNLKQCRKCGQYFPPTLEFFQARHETKDGLFSICRKCRCSKQREWELKNRDRRLIEKKQYYINHPEWFKERTRKFNKYQPERARAYHREWKAKNPERYNLAVRLGNQKRKARKKSLPNTFTEQDWQNALEFFGHKCAVCGRKPDFWTNLAMDHWIPLNSDECPGTVPDNIIPLCNTKVDKEKPVGVIACNQSKRDTLPEEWLIRRFGKCKAKQILAQIREYFSALKQ